MTKINGIKHYFSNEYLYELYKADIISLDNFKLNKNMTVSYDLVTSNGKEALETDVYAIYKNFDLLDICEGYFETEQLLATKYPELYQFMIDHEQSLGDMIVSTELKIGDYTIYYDTL